MKKREKKWKKNKSLKDTLNKKFPIEKNQKQSKVAPSPSKEELLKQELEKVKNDYLYLRAEFDNFKKQSFKEKQELAQYSGESFIKSFIENVLDDLERALESNKDHKTFEEFQKGIQLILKKLYETFKQFQIEVIDPTGQVFDPSYQEALSRAKTSKVAEGHVVVTFKKAYKLYGKVIRPAQVVVADKTTEDT